MSGPGIRTRSAIVIGAFVLTLAAVCASMLRHLAHIRLDERRVLEESREAVLNQELTSALDELDVVVRLARAQQATAGTGGGDTTDVGLSVTRVRAALRGLRELPADDREVSNREHTAREERLYESIDRTLADMDATAHDAGGTLDRITAPLGAARGLARAFAEETRAEAARAQRDLERSLDASTRILVVTIAAGVLALLASWLWLWRSIVQPLGVLRASAERFAAGDLAHRIQLQRSDELGVLVNTFHRMADHLARDQQELETQVRERTQQLVRASLLADLGTLAAGLAHEINTPIASIASCAEGFARRVQNGGIAMAEQKELLQTIAAEAYRVKEITGRLLELARHEPGVRRRIELGALVGEIARILHHSIATRGVGVSLQADPEAWVDGNPGELKQVLLNLLANARDASPRGSVITVRCRREGENVVVEVRDQGAGVPTAVRERIFLPFFTTKPAGQGTGLGLALAARIAADHGGGIELVDGAAPGATFRLRLPAAEAPA